MKSSPDPAIFEVGLGSASSSAAGREHATSGEVQWGCVSQRACECGQALYGKLYEPLPGADKWFRIVEEYCTRRLTYAADRLTAIAGLARAMGPVLQERWYVAGLWLSPRWTPLTLQSLLWTAELCDKGVAVGSKPLGSPSSLRRSQIPPSINALPPKIISPASSSRPPIHFDSRRW